MELNIGFVSDISMLISKVIDEKEKHLKMSCVVLLEPQFEHDYGWQSFQVFGTY